MVKLPTSDHHARALLPIPFSPLIPKPDRKRSRAAQHAIRVLSAGLVDHIALRTAAIDAAVDESVSRGVRQLVILGAGLDLRAYRLESPSAPFVYSRWIIPSTQRYRRDRHRHVLFRWPARSGRSLVDFARDSARSQT
ncbi:MAG: class I SAM-dependent methyltransferase [Polyangiaceae bacterium]